MEQCSVCAETQSKQGRVPLCKQGRPACQWVCGRRRGTARHELVGGQADGALVVWVAVGVEVINDLQRGSFVHSAHSQHDSKQCAEGQSHIQKQHTDSSCLQTHRHETYEPETYEREMYEHPPQTQGCRPWSCRPQTLCCCCSNTRSTSPACCPPGKGCCSALHTAPK